MTRIARKTRPVPTRRKHKQKELKPNSTPTMRRSPRLRPSLMRQSPAPMRPDAQSAKCVRLNPTGQVSQAMSASAISAAQAEAEQSRLATHKPNQCAAGRNR